MAVTAVKEMVGQDLQSTRTSNAVCQGDVVVAQQPVV